MEIKKDSISRMAILRLMYLEDKESFSEMDKTFFLLKFLREAKFHFDSTCFWHSIAGMRKWKFLEQMYEIQSMF